MKQITITQNSLTSDSKELTSEVINKKIKLKYSNHSEVIPFEKIIRLEGDCNYTIVYTESKKYISSRTLKHYEGILDNNFFVRVHKSHIVNMSFMKSIGVQESSSEIVLEEGKLIEISRRKLKEIVEKFDTYNNS